MSDNEEVQQVDSLETLASQYGWGPEKGDKTAADFVKVALDKHSKQSKTIEHLHRTVDELKNHMGMIEQRTYERAVKELESQRRVAIQEGNVELVDQIEKAKADLAPTPVESKPEVLPAIKEFEDKHKAWLNGTSLQELKMQKFVEDMGQLLGKRKLDPDQHMKLLDEAVLNEYPDYFKTDVDSPVIGRAENVAGQISTAKKTKFTMRDLNDTQKQVARDFERTGIMTIDQFIDSLVRNGELK